MNAMNASINDISLGDLVMSLQQNSEINKSQSVTLTQALKDWNVSLTTEDDKSKHTVRSYNQHINNFISYTVCASVDEIQPVDILKFKEYLVDIVNRSEATINSAIVALRSFFSFCQLKGYIDNNPCLKIKGVRSAEIEPKALDDSTVNKLRNRIEIYCKKRNDYNHLLMFDFMLKVGLRVSEVVELKFRDITPQGNGLVVKVKLGKGNKSRIVAMPSDLASDYKQFKASLHRSKDSINLVFHHKNPYTPTAIRNFYGRLCKRENLAHVHPHMLRHTFSTRQVREYKTDIDVLQKMLGHSNLTTTARYLTTTLEDQQEAQARQVAATTIVKCSRTGELVKRNDAVEINGNFYSKASLTDTELALLTSLTG